MHPILARTDRIVLYLGAWVIPAVLLAAVMTRQGLGWAEAAVLLAPIVLVYAFVCLSAWYVCRATPLGPGRIWNALTSSLLASIVAAALWIGLARLWVVGLGQVPAFASATARYREQFPLLFAAGVLLFLLSLAVHYVLVAFDLARAAERRQLELEVLSRNAELRALRAQIDPHFLYNNLNSISALTGSDPAGARRMCVLLADFLRNTIEVGARPRISLADELALAEHFLSIEQVRFGSRLRIERHIDEAASKGLVPPLLLQPLVENAITHGIARLLEGGVIRLDIAREDGRLSIAIENPRDPDEAIRRSSGVGLDNVRRRLDAAFGGDARMETKAESQRFRVRLDLPWSTEAPR